MSNLIAPNKKEETKSPSAQTQKGIENHKEAAKHHEEAAKLHHEAAKHHEEGNHHRAFESTLKAHGHNALANEKQKEDVKMHALNSDSMMM